MGRVLLKCWAGCTQESVIDGLRARGLWSSGPGRYSRSFIPRPKPRDDRELRWLVEDIFLLDCDPEAAQVWTFLQQAADVSPLALDVVSRALSKVRPSCAPLVRTWLDEFMAPTEPVDQREAA